MVVSLLFDEKDGTYIDPCLGALGAYSRMTASLRCQGRAANVRPVDTAQSPPLLAICPRHVSQARQIQPVPPFSRCWKLKLLPTIHPFFWAVQPAENHPPKAQK
eukprot:2707130-Amphidinium_carterae.1